MLVPAPREVAVSLVAGFRDLSFPVGIGASMLRMAIGYAIAVLIGLPLGMAVARYRLARDTVGSAALGLQTLPSVCWLPLALLWFGLSEKAIIFVVVMGATFCVTTAVDDGIRNVAPLLVKAGHNLGAHGLRLQWTVVLPAALPTIVTGLKLAWSFAWRSLMAGELLYSEKGLGRILMMGRDLGDMAQVIAAIMVILALGLLVNRVVFQPLEQGIARRYGLTAGALAR
jgi:NitT/TauT family transport system permease protein